MTWLARLERRFGRHALPNVTLYLVVGQALFYVIGLGRPTVVEKMLLVPARVLEGEVWRLATFLFIPPSDNPLFAFFALYLLYLMGTALEMHWGAFRYNVYLLIAVGLTVASAWLVPETPGTNLYISTSVFLAFAFLYPDFELLLFFILPVKVRWLAAVTWILLVLAFLDGDWARRFYIQASVANFFLFFGREILQRAKMRGRSHLRRAVSRPDPDRALHRCAVCGITDRTHPTMDFRYCPACTGGRGYCTEHIFDHEHR